MYPPLRKINEVAFSVTSTSQLVLAANERRKYCILINDSNQNIYIRMGSTAVANQGILIAANGFAYQVDAINLWLGDIYAIHAGSGSKNLLIQEFS